MSPRVHGGPDGGAPVPFDFSTNANACGPCPLALAAVQGAEVRRYPDPHYHALRERLARHHGVEAARILPAVSGSEAIQRLTALAVQGGLRRVSLPDHAYGDYRLAAQAWGLPTVRRGAEDATTLAWACDPSSPLGHADGPPSRTDAAMRVLDRAYAPLRLEGIDPWTPESLDAVWQLWTPNKALGMTGIRAAYLIAPPNAAAQTDALERLAPSWPIGGHGVALLDAWCRPEVQAWLADSRLALGRWKRLQRQVCESLGWHCLPSEANFFVARLPAGAPGDLIDRLRASGVRLRDCASFGLPGHVRLGVLPPGAQQALADAVRRIAAAATTMHAPPP